MTESPKFWDRIADKYARSPISDQAAYERKLDQSRAWFTPHTRVLEIGCGTGTTAIAHAPHVHSILATDISSRMIDIAREKAGAAGLDNVRFEQQSIGELAVADATYDVVMAHSILHLVDERAPVINDIYRWLRPGGLLIASTACLGDALGFFRYVGPVGRWLGLVPLVRVFTRAELEADIGAAGFSLETSWQPGRTKAVFTIARKPQAGNADTASTARVCVPAGVESARKSDPGTISREAVAAA